MMLNSHITFKPVQFQYIIFAVPLLSACLHEKEAHILNKLDRKVRENNKYNKLHIILNVKCY